MRLISLTQGKFAKVDDSDFHWLNQWKWLALKRSHTFYAARYENRPRRCIMMHQVISGLFAPDHKDGDGLNNQRYNLRPATRAQQSANTKRRRDNTSGFKGVSFYRSRGNWEGYIDHLGKRKKLGYFTDPKEAARAYDEAAKELFGEFAKLNFP